MIEEEKRQFFATQTKPLHTVHMSGKRVVLANFPESERRKVMDRLKEKDQVLALGDKGILPGIKINGKEVTRDNIHEFELKPKVDKVIEKLEEKIKPKIELEETKAKKVSKAKKTKKGGK